MASVHNDVPLPAPARDVWDAVRDFGALPQRLVPGFVTACQLDGDARIVTFANGSVAREVLAQPKLMLVLRRRSAKPIIPKPPTIIAQVAASGTAENVAVPV